MGEQAASLGTSAVQWNTAEYEDRLPAPPPHPRDTGKKENTGYWVHIRGDFHKTPTAAIERHMNRHERLQP